MSNDLTGHQAATTWTDRATLLWSHRRLFGRVACFGFAASLLIACVLPKQYRASASIMPPSNASSSGALFAAIAGRALGGSGGGSLSSLASLFGFSNSTALFVSLLHSGTVTGRIVDQFNLQHVYHKRYKTDAVRSLGRHTIIQDDKKSGVITISVEDTDPQRARDMTAAYLQELNLLLNRTSTSSAHQERVFIERRLLQAKQDLEHAQQALSEFSSTHTTIDLKEQTRAEVSAAAALQAQIMLEESNISSLRQIYGDGNIRLRAAEARAATLRTKLASIGGSSQVQPDTPQGEDSPLYLPLRQVPRLAVPFADRYREVQTQEKIFELLTEQFEIAKITEAKDTPVLSIIDYPAVPEKKSFPPRALLTLGLWVASLLCLACGLLLCDLWRSLPAQDPKRVLFQNVVGTFQTRFSRTGQS